jgi:hypothetical protein
VNGYGPGADYGDEAQLAGIGGHLDMAGASEAQRAAQDIEDALARRPSFDHKIARALQRIGQGTYTPDAYYRDRTADGQFTGRVCGEGLDDFGRCRSRYHDSACLEVLRASAATSGAETVLAWNRALRRNGDTAAALALANAEAASWDDLLGPDEAASIDALTHVRQLLGLGGPAPQHRPDLGWLRRDLGLR